MEKEQKTGTWGYRFRIKLATGHYLSPSRGEFNRVKCIVEINAKLAKMKQEQMYVCLAKNIDYSGLLFKAIHHRIKTEDHTRHPIILKAHELDIYKKNGTTGKIGEVIRLNIHSPTGPVYPIDDAGYPIYVGLTNDELSKLYLALGNLKEVHV